MRLFADTTSLRVPEFRRLWAAGVPTVIGANLTIFAVPVQIYALTESSAYVGLAGLFALVPLVVFGLLGGAWADAMDRRLLLILASCGLGAASLLLWLQAVMALNNVWVVLSLLAFQQAFFGINCPTRSAAIPRLLPGEQLPAANALNMTVTQFGAIAGPLLAGVLLNWVDLSTLYLIDTLTCLAPVWATYRLAPIPPGETSDAAGAARWGMGAVLQGFRYLAGNTVVLMSFVVDLIAMVLGMPRALFPQMAHQSFGGPVEGGSQMALLAAAMSVGAVAGGVFSGWLPRIRRQGMAVVVAIVAWGAAMVGFGLISGEAHGRATALLWTALAFLALGGAADMVSSAFRQTILQQAASENWSDGCRACSPWWWAADPGWPMRCTARRPRRSGRPPQRPAAVHWSFWESGSPRWPPRSSFATGLPKSSAARIVPGSPDGLLRNFRGPDPAQARRRHNDYLQS